MSRRTVTSVAVVLAVLLIPAVAFAASGNFTSSSSSTAAVTATNSASTGKGVHGRATSTSTSTHYGVYGGASGSGGIGVFGSGSKYGVYSNGNLGVASGKQLVCTRCVGATDVRIPAIRVVSSAGQVVVAHNAGHELTWDVEVFDNAGMHSSTNPSRLYAPVSGIYLVTAGVAWLGTTAENARLVLGAAVNGTEVGYETQGATTGTNHLSFSTHVWMDAGEYIVFSTSQSTGGNLAIQHGNCCTFATMQFVSS